MTAVPDIEFRGVAKRYGAVTAVSGIDLAVPPSAFVALLGPSGCGKTTCLRMIGGFEQPSEGQVFIRGQDMAGTPPYRRPVNMVFQQYALFPHLDVEANVSYGLRQARPRLSSRDIGRRAGEALEMVRLAGYGGRKIHELSGGQQQRVALARALVNKPAVLLLDEPLAALDKKLRTDMQIELQNLQREIGITFVLVTHDQEEALSMSDFVCVMNGGRIVQLGQPSEIYDEPADLFVADFVGKTNLLSGTVAGHTGDLVDVALADGTVVAARKRTALRQGETVSVSLRPESLSLGAPESGPLKGIVRNRIFLGSTAEYAIEVQGIGTLLAKADHLIGQGNLFKPGEPVAIGYAMGTPLAFPETKNNGTNQRVNKHVEIIS
ncbi:MULTISPECIES: ABC transporter ATP-binding protein [Mesorhizobium]|uniref:ABC-type spermidine/putrescine transport system, ATPase component n=1 Tax=Mesorhizobium australicum (strain HAMBI 3006 / LMG 24608 / WSM2073) TaxID=754035 RepID=L0KF28_MESAW|nr:MULTISPECIES: ABC transporter ATP-binding protein [Mesorhizobium]AGB43616.1 ABC-type spermidine/putrescine transport system, ATPase component [Mesorhizobium australicum WSM2073]MBZ9695925.1 ABC transporter ATP-binding protein [Mesorhizobium sp. CO1-1-9]MBZ9975860.1 ABC transporter ATP-binding protein [Mesorhizobium sp. BR-1-1-10]TPJ20390.1 ABC transporter ATP-binding protein [Mesorhizobium sp. B2-7-3]TPK15374.1 ABC transporter ATP-binding protein [Mesorhizobium sp. B2-5-7]